MKETKEPDICRYRELCASRLEDVLRRIDGRWKMPILAFLSNQESMRFSDLERAIPQASQKMLTQHLRELERDGIVARTIYPQVPPKVEYRLTSQGRKLKPAFLALLDWADSRDAEEDVPPADYRRPELLAGR
jgi:DNA-binding HxlR family transcriptional regulator